MSPLNFIRSDIQAMSAYVVQPAAGMVKLDAMENPYTLSPDLQAKLGARLGAVALNRYPSQRTEDLKTALEHYIDMPAGFALMLGNGSDELISLLSLACQAPGAVALAPEPGFVMYALSTHLQGLTYVPVSLTADFELDEAAMSAAIAQHQPAIVYLAYPNNPSANLWDAAVIRRLIAQVSAYGGWVVLDEAYQPFSSLTWWDEIRRDPAANAQGDCPVRQNSPTLQHQRAQRRVCIVCLGASAGFPSAGAGHPFRTRTCHRRFRQTSRREGVSQPSKYAAGAL
jgi:histidinol-phosphate aminotransferase